jgi:hydrogenase maturation protease
VTRLVVLAWGNPGRGDDALGPEFLRHAAGSAPPAGHDIEYVTDFQLQPEHATDLIGRDLALFVDASMAAPAPFAFSAVVPARDLTFTSHAMSPAAVLAACADAFGPPPPAFVLAIRGEHFELGEPMGAAARETLRQALAFYERLLEDPTASAWKKAMPVSSAR